MRVGTVLIAAMVVAAIAGTGQATLRELGSLEPLWNRCEGVAVEGEVLYVIASNGLHTFDIRNPLAPEHLGVCEDLRNATTITVSGGYCYVTESEGDLVAIDARNPARPVRVATLDTPGNACGTAVQGNFCYVADYYAIVNNAPANAGVCVVNIEEPENPQLTGVWGMADAVHGVAVSGNFVYAAAGGLGVRVVNVEEPDAPRPFGWVRSEGHVYSVAVAGNFCYAFGETGFLVIDVEDPWNLEIVGRLEDISTRRSASIAVAGNYCYVTGWDCGLRIIDVGNPAEPREVGWSIPVNTAQNVAVSGEICYLAAGTSDLQIFDIREPEDIRPAGAVTALTAGRQIIARGGYGYVSDEHDGLHIYDVRSPEAMREVWTYGTTGGQICLSGNLLYAACGDDGLRVWDVRDPNEPELVSVIDTLTGVTGVNVRNGYCYVTSRNGFAGCLRVFDFRNPVRPVHLAYWNAAGKIYCSGDYGFTHGGSSSVTVWSFRDPRNPSPLSTIRDLTRAWVVTVIGDYVYIGDRGIYGDDPVTLKVYDIRNVFAPQLVRTIDMPAAAYSGVRDGNYLLVADTEGGLRIFNTRDPDNPTEVAVYANMSVFGVDIDENGRYCLLSSDRFGVFEPDYVQDIPLRAGWNMMSTYREVGDDFAAFWTDLVRRNRLLLVKDQAGRFYVPGVFNNINVFNFREGYMAKLSEADTLAVVRPSLRAGTPIPVSAGWNIVAYYPRDGLTAEQAFGGLGENLVMVKDENGRFYSRGAGFGNMGELQRGKGYFVKVAVDGWLVYPD